MYINLTNGSLLILWVIFAKDILSVNQRLTYNNTIYRLNLELNDPLIIFKQIESILKCQFKRQKYYYHNTMIPLHV